MQAPYTGALHCFPVSFLHPIANQRFPTLPTKVEIRMAKKPASKKPAAEPSEKPAAAEQKDSAEPPTVSGQVVSLDRFRKK